MAVPDYQSCMRPLLQFCADGREKSISEAAAFVAAALLTVGLCAFGAHRLGRALPKHFNPGLPGDLRIDDAGTDARGQA